ncbi:MAG TPA: hypothetical protein VHV26_10530 [Rhizomicrobium sp.]|jgi:hypothetical protein|nr:hypothetical protein [Rhizomicrobium sp.]
MTTRRNIMAGAAGGLALLGGALWRFTDLFVKHYPPTPYDDVLARLIDRERAARLGAAALRGMPGFDADRAAARLRSAFATGGLSVAATIDVVNGRMLEADGWLLPQSVALLSALAAKA